MEDREKKQKSKLGATGGESPSVPAKEETAADLLKSEIAEVKIRKAKGSKNITSGICHIKANATNTHVTFTDRKGNVISWATAGRCGFRGSRKSTAYAAQMAAQTAGQTAMSHGLKEVVIQVKGIGLGRDAAMKVIPSLGLTATEILEMTSIPHGGCRAPKQRRV